MRYFVLHKPFGMVSQFVSKEAVPLLGEIDFNFPTGTHAIGRLDATSEGLLLLTTDKRITRLLFQGPVPHRREYLVRVKGKVQPETVDRMRLGLLLAGRKQADYMSKPCTVELVEKPDWVNDHPQQPAFAPHTWLLMGLEEGRYHQVRKMVAAVGHRCQRLIRVSIEGLVLEGLAPGAVRELSAAEFFSQLNLTY
ncbi:MAG TPA: pseudouridine synthase [Flavihumibacter sp.]|nr:pseudouridine synthase [Bacteroidota bacterium]HOA39213.1 pseudouridine synthase [Flavihumibacter sp.]HPZ87372.1 pseudouridine synthase [Flavihumibacter sp.]